MTNMKFNQLLEKAHMEVSFRQDAEKVIRMSHLNSSKTLLTQNIAASRFLGRSLLWKV